MKNHILSASIYASLFIASIAFGQTRLKVGDHAPELPILRWIKGDHSFSFKKGKLYVLDFWDGSFDPKSKTVSQIASLAGKYHDRVVFVGVNCPDTTGKIAADHSMVVESSFIEKLGESMQYIVTLDNKDKKANNRWHVGSDKMQPPVLIVVGNEGSIIGMGNSVSEIEKVLGRQIAGKREPVVLKKHMSKRVVKSGEIGSHAFRSSFFVNDNVSRRFDKVDRLAENGEYNKALRELDSLGSENPSLQPIIQHRKFTLLLRVNEEEAYALARTMLAGSFKDDSFVLDEMAWQIVDDKTGLISPDYNTAIELARRAVQLDLSEDPLSLDTLAYAYFKKGDVERAVELGEMAVEQLKSRRALPDSRLKEIPSHLALYKRKVQ